MTTADDLPRRALRIEGDWTLARLPTLTRWLRDQPPDSQQRLDASGLQRLDTAGACLLLDWLGGAETWTRIDHLSPAHCALLRAVAEAAPQQTPAPRPPSAASSQALTSLGAWVQQFIHDALQLLGFMGLALTTTLRLLPHPQRWRWTAWVAQLDQTGLRAVPIVSLLTFLVGCVVAFLGATILASFGASIFTIQLVAFSFLREFGVLLTAIIVAGRSGSAFTAQLGSMKAREEIDALRALGLDPMEVLVMPRVLALVLAVPMLSFIGMIAGMVGGALVCALNLDLSPTLFIARVHDTTPIRHFWVGMVKAPILAVMIALIGCLEGFKVSGSAESVGAHTTSSVVQSIFMVILIDALAAIFFMEIGL